MTTTGLALILGSVVLHVTWNVWGKRAHPGAAFFLVANAVGALVFAPFVLVHAGGLAAVSARAWLWLVVTGAFQALYCVGLAAAYRAGDLSHAYPVARSFGPVFVALVSVSLGRAAAISPGCALGIAAIVVGGAVLPLSRFSAFRHELWSRCSGFALFAAAVSAGYTVVDDHGLRILRESGLSVRVSTCLWVPLEAASSALMLAFWVLARPSGRRALATVLATGKRDAARVGVGIYAAYGLVLAAYAFVDDVTYAAAFRQLSVPLGALVGVRALGETLPRPKVLGLVLMTVGLVLVALS
jgi:uncharacterized membrane protein